MGMSEASVLNGCISDYTVKTCILTAEGRCSWTQKILGTLIHIQRQQVGYMRPNPQFLRYLQVYKLWEVYTFIHLLFISKYHSFYKMWG